MTFHARFYGPATPFYTGTGLSSEVPGRYPIALNGRPFILDEKDEAFAAGWRTTPLLREQADSSDETGEQSINPEELWRRAGESWHRGAGQTYFDRRESDRFSFRSSKGINPWEKWQISLLNDTQRKRTSAETNLAVLPVGTYCYAADGNSVLHTQSLSGTPTWTSADIQAGEAAQSVKSITSDGYNVFAALGSNGIHLTTRGATSSSHYSALSCTLVSYVKGRLMAANGNSIYNVIASGAAPSALYTHANTDFAWVGFAAGPRHIFAAGYSGDKSLVYRIALKEDGSGLEVPTAALADGLPDGEIIRSIDSYLGFVLLGTDNGVRFATANDDGTLSVGALIETSGAVRCFEGQGRFVWFGWTNYDSTSTGLGRLNLQEILPSGAPAYASDLMTSTQGNVLSVCTFGDKRVFAVSGSGIYAEEDTKVATGTIDSGLITYGLPDPKVAVYLDLRHEPLEGTVSVYVAADRSDFTRAGVSSQSDSTAPTALPVGQLEGETHEVRLELARSASDTETGPDVTRWTLRSFPAPLRGRTMILPILVHEKMVYRDGDITGDPESDLAYLHSLVALQDLVRLQDLSNTHSVKVEDTEFVRWQPTADYRHWQGTCRVKVKEPAE